MVLLEGVGDVFEEDQAEDDVLVLRRVHVVAQLVGGEPELGLEAQRRTVAVGFSPSTSPSGSLPPRTTRQPSLLSLNRDSKLRVYFTTDDRSLAQFPVSIQGASVVSPKIGVSGCTK